MNNKLRPSSPHHLIHFSPLDVATDDPDPETEAELSASASEARERFGGEGTEPEGQLVKVPARAFQSSLRQRRQRRRRRQRRSKNCLEPW